MFKTLLKVLSVRKNVEPSSERRTEFKNSAVNSGRIYKHFQELKVAFIPS